jgi:hypothetical protein
MGEPERRRRRLRPPSAAAAEAAAAEAAATQVAAAPADAGTAVIETMPVEDPEEVLPARPRPRLPRAPTSGAGYVDDRDVERGLRGLVGSGSSQVSVGAALRARDATRPTEAQLAEAERSLAIVRRNWSPPR